MGLNRNLGYMTKQPSEIKTYSDGALPTIGENKLQNIVRKDYN